MGLMDKWYSELLAVVVLSIFFHHAHRPAGHKGRRFCRLQVFLVRGIDYIVSLDSEHIESVVSSHLVVHRLDYTNGHCHFYLQRSASIYAFYLFLAEQNSGTSAAFIGNTPRSNTLQTATVQIDNGSSFNINYEDPNPPTYKQWYITPTLSDGNHTITITNLRGTSIDYAVVAVGNHTSLTDQTVIVDDDSSLIQYSGQWSRNTNEFIPGSLPLGYPYGNVTHRSSTPGDTFKFQFSGMRIQIISKEPLLMLPYILGTSLAVYGIFSWYNVGSSLTATYTVDGTPHSSSISVTASSPSYLNQDGEVSNYLYFGLDNLSSGTHTLVVNITQVDNQIFILDYITYKPSFDSLSSMPAISLNTSGTTGSSASLPTSSASSANSGGSQHSVSTADIVGGVVGALAFGILVTILVTLSILRRRRARERKYAYQEAELPNGAVEYPGCMPHFSFHLFDLFYLCFIDSSVPHTSQTQEPVRPQIASGAISPFTLSDSQRSPGADVKHAVHGAHSVTDASSIARPVDSSITGTSTGIEEPLVDPPSYDAISGR
jgi:hypothetical protein